MLNETANNPPEAYTGRGKKITKTPIAKAITNALFVTRLPNHPRTFGTNTRGSSFCSGSTLGGSTFFLNSCFGAAFCFSLKLTLSLAGLSLTILLDVVFSALAE